MMYRIALLILFCLSMTVVAQAQSRRGKAKSETEPVVAQVPVLAWEKTNHDFGDIKQGDTVSHAFVFSNTGNAPAIITHVQTTCGCTASEYPKTPVLPGQKAQVRVIFNSAGKIGRQNKVVTVMTNLPKPEETLTLSGTVLPNPTK